MEDVASRLLWLAREIGREDRDLVIRSEGNVSARLDDHRFLVKGSGAVMAEATSADFSPVDLPGTLRLLDMQGLDEAGLIHRILGLGLDPDRRPPSVECCFHAWLLELPGIRYIAHCHPTAVLQVLCSPAAEKLADHRLYPDEVRHCGAQSVYVPYADPGITLAREIRSRVEMFMRRNYDRVPRVILLQNHGVIVPGETPEAVLTTTLMVEKAARILVGVARLGGAVFLPTATANRLDRCTPRQAGRRHLKE